MPTSERHCAIPGCEKRARQRGWCQAHYMRWYRHGDPLATMIGEDFTLSNGRRYRSMKAPQHPLAMKNGKVYVHRAVLFEAIGYGPHCCYWCGCPVQWGSTLQVDHLDGFGDNNEPSNLVPSCNACNSGRALRAWADAQRQRGWWARRDTQRRDRAA